MPVPQSKSGLPSEPSPSLNAANGAPVDHADLSPMAALEVAYRSEAPKLARYFRDRLSHADEAVDLVQEAFLRLAARIAQHPVAHPGPYLQRIARNLLVDRSKRLEHRLSAFHIPIGDGIDLPVGPEQGHHIEANDVIAAYRRALDELPEKTRTIFILHRIDELTYAEIGMRLGISIPTVQYHVARALSHIDAALEQG